MDALILSCGTGGGHNAAGAAIKEELIKRGYNVKFFNPYALKSNRLARVIDRAYVGLVQKAPNVFGVVYKIGNAYRKLPFHSPVYYANGKVYGFNYVTGEEVYDNNVKDENVNLANYILENLSTANISYNINKADYIAATELAGKLDKVSIEEATEKINKENNQNIEVDININGENDNNSDINDSDSNIANKDNNVISSKSQTTENILNTTQNNKNNLDNKYVTTYDPGTQSYVVYSTAELIKSDAPKTQTENEKINGNKDLISYYTNLSTSKEKLKDTDLKAPMYGALSD